MRTTLKRGVGRGAALTGNGAAGPGMRPVIADTRIVAGQLAAIEVYCPDELEDFRQYVDDLRSEQVTGS